ncbi:hypothetical protein, partial [Leclercia adecarboxylata]|uniref:hypothetical protein n=1 Tax=Leclercia adecarboxylata TaxID=83655 RepID=UPI00234E1622
EIAVEKDVFGVRQCETRLEQAREQHDELAEVLDRHQQQFFETTTRIDRLEQDQANRCSRETQLATDIATARRELDEQRRVSEGDQARLAAIDERFDDLQPEHEALEEQLENLEQALADASPALEAAEQQWA